MADKTCRYCGDTKDVSLFVHNRKVCIDCYRAEARKRWHKKNPDAKDGTNGEKGKDPRDIPKNITRITPFY